MMTRKQTFRLSNKRQTARRALLAAAAMVAICLPQGLAAGGVVKLPFSTGNFSDPLDIDNIFLPLQPGPTKIYKAEGADGCEEDHFTVTNETEVISFGAAGNVTTRVVRDLAYEDPECDGLALILVERTDDWFAQDNSGNVWYFGEKTEDCVPTPNPDDPPTEVVCSPGPGGWRAGVDGAEAGIIMLDDPDNGEQYHQEFYEGVAEDQAKITGVDVKVILERDDALSPGTFTGCLKTKEWNPLSPGHVEQKYYCPNIGVVAVDEHHGKELRFELTGAAADAFRFRRVPGSR